MNTAITSVPLTPSPESVLRRAAHAFVAWVTPRREPLSREQLAELHHRRRMADQLEEERRRAAAVTGRLFG
jgi:hypothetical protein